jgi:23S rRNA pseudouridine2605 synthase
MTEGRVTVNGLVVTALGAKVDPTCDAVAVDGRPVTLPGAAAYLVLNKPRGCVTTMNDPQGRPTVAELVPASEYPGLFPVGRLDADTTGVLLFTTDGELGFRLIHPRYHVPKTYRVVAEGRMADASLERLRRGIELDDGPTAPASVERVVAVHRGAARATTTEVEITIREGRKRQVRRMFSAVGHPVVNLERTTFGPVALGTLDPGETRLLDDDEVASLREAAGLDQR